MDKYDEAGKVFLKKFFKDPSGVEDKLPEMVARALREAAAEAYEDAAIESEKKRTIFFTDANILHGDRDLRVRAQMRKEIAAALRGKADALRG